MSEISYFKTVLSKIIKQKNLASQSNVICFSEKVITMSLTKTTAIVKTPNSLELEKPLTDVTEGEKVEVFISSLKTTGNWKKVLSEMGTYSEDELQGFSEIRKEIIK